VTMRPSAGIIVPYEGIWLVRRILPFGDQLNTHFFDLENVTRDNLRSFDFEETTVTENHSLQCKCLFQFVDDRTGLEFLDETDCSIEQQQGANDTEIDPILETSGEDSSSLSARLLLARRNSSSRVAAPGIPGRKNIVDRRGRVRKRGANGCQTRH
jgi:hypothetical protein